ncbi:hypothetical protein [Pseudonocardia lacus]|uniref:hypothetical protein n=1 Tax=Pseudonocardia lacus TaxID=2835865 RepID=UPI001BDCDC92|nr:hypothetical protein [Pseudonocardia lacus]
MPDETTRLLCAAAHRYEWFAEAVIKEYLVEQVGSVPPSPGLDSTAVLRDAVAARARHRVRNTVVLALLIALAVLDPLVVLLWTALALAGRKLLATRPRLVNAAELLAVIAVLALLGSVVSLKALTGIGLPMGDSTWWPSLAIAIALLGLLVGETWLVRTFLRRRFRSDNFVADHTAAASAVERRLRGFGLRRYRGQLERFAAADEHSEAAARCADVVVHRGETPFVGAGYVLPTQTVPIALRPAAGRKEPPEEIGVRELYDRIRAEIVPTRTARRSDGRIDAVVHREQLLVPVDDLMHERGTWPGDQVLGDLDEPPVRHLPIKVVRDVEAEQIEWARYYSCLRRESWKRNLVTSSYLHLHKHNRMLRIEVTHCVLPPVREWLTETDRVLRLGDGPLISGSVELLRLPLTVPARVRSVARSLRPRKLRTRGIDADRYGAGGSLREGVSHGSEETHFFKIHDATGQVRSMHNEIFAVIIDHLEERGYDVSELGNRAATMIENHTMNINNSTFVNSDITNGAVNPQPAKPAPTPAPTPTPAPSGT